MKFEILSAPSYPGSVFLCRKKEWDELVREAHGKRIQDRKQANRPWSS